jgi:hypothetical protein
VAALRSVTATTACVLLATLTRLIVGIAQTPS